MPRAAPQRARASWWGVVAALTALAACETLEGESHPYTPFAVASGARKSAALEAPDAGSASQPRIRAVPRIVQAPARATRWQVVERELEAPEGLMFRMGLVGALEGGSESDVLAWLVGTPGSHQVGEAWFYPAAQEPRRLAQAPSFIPTGPSCRHAAQLTQSGPASVMLDVHARCDSPLLPRAPTRSVSVLAPRRTLGEMVRFRLADPAPGEKLGLRVTSRDRDQDGRDDVELELTLTPPAGAPATARFIWLDRTAGLSRDASEPQASFRRLAAAAVANPKERDQRYATLLRLHSSACAASAVPRLFTQDGSGLDCGDLQKPLEQLTQAAVAAALSDGDVVAALAALQRYRWSQVGATPAGRFEQNELERIWKRVQRRRVVKLVPLKSQPRSMGSVPRFSPLSFHADGSLLLQTADGVVRSAPDGRYEYDASEEVDPWPTVVVSPEGHRLTGVAFPCDRSEVSLTRTDPAGSPLEPIATNLMAPRPGSCALGRSFRAPAVTPLAWGRGGPSAYVGLARVGPAIAAPAPLGSATSPNGRFTILGTEWGLLVVGSREPELWAFDDDRLARHLEHCVISNNAQAAACVLAGRAYVVLPDPKAN